MRGVLSWRMIGQASLAEALGIGQASLAEAAVQHTSELLRHTSIVSKRCNGVSRGVRVKRVTRVLGPLCTCATAVRCGFDLCHSLHDVSDLSIREFRHQTYSDAAGLCGRCGGCTHSVFCSQAKHTASTDKVCLLQARQTAQGSVVVCR